MIRHLVVSNLSPAGAIIRPDAATVLPDSAKFITRYSLCKVESGTSYKMRWLVERWTWCNTHMFGGRLRTPNFVISRANKDKTLGVWRPSKREMELAHKLFLLKDEAHAVGTLIHEMAHQYNDEVEHTTSLEDREDDFRTKGHGRVWKSIMERLGQPTDAGFTGDHTELLDYKKQKVIEQLDSGQRILINNTELQKKEKHFLVFVDKKKGTEKIICATNKVRPKPNHPTEVLVAAFDTTQVRYLAFSWYPLSSCYVAMPSKVKKEAPELLSVAAEYKHEEIMRHLSPGPV